MKISKVIKAILFGILVFFGFSIGVNAKTIKANVTIIWADYKDGLNFRPDSVDIHISSMYDRVGKDITLSKNDVVVAEKDDYSTWTGEIKFDSDTENDFYGASISNVPNGYFYNQAAEYCDVDDNGGTIRLVLTKNTYAQYFITVNYHDDNGRDKGKRGIEFNLSQPKINYDKDFSFGKGSKYYKGDTFTETLEEWEKAIYTEDSESEDYLKPVVYEVSDTLSIDNRKVVYTWDGYNLNVDVYYSASKTTLPIKVVWDDKENVNGKRPDSILVKAYDQNDSLEKEITISKDTDYIVSEEVFKNVKYSNGEEIIYNLKVDDSNNYKYEVKKEDDTYVITGTYIEEEKEEIIKEESVKENKKEENVVNPKTSDNLVFYIILSILSSLGLVGVFYYKRKSIM